MVELTLREATLVFGVDVREVTAIVRGELIARRDGRGFLVNADELERWLRQSKAKAG